MFEAIWQRLTLAQRAVLRAVVLDEGRELLSADSRTRHRLGGASSVQTALGALVRDDLIAATALATPSSIRSCANGLRGTPFKRDVEMKVIIAGGSGLLGSALSAALADERHEVVVLTRRSGSSHASRVSQVQWTPDGGVGAWTSALDSADAVINLAGEPIGAGRWSAARKQRIEDSRVLATRSLVNAIEASGTPPPVLISGSAVGYYGPCGDEVVTEASPAGTDFLAHVCASWEAEAIRAVSSRVRVVRLRTGLVLDRRGGALPRMLLPFRLGAGGPLGSGRQYWPWIHIDDWVSLVRWAMVTPGLSGPVNATSPTPVPNAEFARSLGRAMHRPALVPTPGFALRLMLGEMADGLLLSGQRAVPAKALDAGFPFRYQRLEQALGVLFT